MKHNQKPALLVLTSSFPCAPDDETCGYIRDFARSLSTEFSVTILAPPDRRASEWPVDVFKLVRSRSVLPLTLDPFQGSVDLNRLASGSLLAKLGALISLVCFFARAVLLAFRADAICSHWMVPSGLVGALIGGLLRKPHIVVEHSGALHLLHRTRWGKRIARFVAESSNRTVTVSHDLQRRLFELCPKAERTAHVIPMGVFRGPPQDPSDIHKSVPQAGSPFLRIVFIGRLTAIKGLDVLLRAMSGLNGSSHLIVAGDGECREELESLATSLSVDVRFMGQIGASERRRLLSVCDVVVIPSRVLDGGRTEGMPLVCIEAMAAGRVVIASRAGGLAEAIVDGENGLLFDQGDHQMLREKLMVALRDESLRLSLGRSARRSAASYDWPRIGAQYCELINSAIRTNDAFGNRRIEDGRTIG